MNVSESPDIVIAGAGPAGIAAALAAHESGARVLVLDDNPAAGGQIWRGGQSNAWLRRFQALGQCTISNCRVVAAETNPLKLVVEHPSGAFRITPRKLILATGAREIFLPFPGWTLPGVMGVGGLQAMAKSGLPVAGKKVVVAGTGPLLLAVAAYLRCHGAKVQLIAEQASRMALVRFGMQLMHQTGKLAQAARLQLALRSVPYLQDCWVTSAEGDSRLRRVTVQRGAKTWTEECDYAAVAYGLYPNTELAALLGCAMSDSGVRVDELQQTSVENVFCAGECTGIGGVDLSVVEGQIAGYAAGGRVQKARELFGKRASGQWFARTLNRAFELRAELKQLPRHDTLVCRCEDVSYARLQETRSFRAAKLHTRCGMGPCQGRVCGPAAEFLFGWHTESIRPPVFPARLGTLAMEKTEEEMLAAK